MNTLGARIKKEREKRGWNQGELANKVNCHIPNLSRWERDEVSPSIDAVIKFSKIFNISLDYLLTGSSALNPALEAIGNRLREVREELLPVKLSTTEIADKLEISVSEYLDYEDGVKELDKEILNKYKKLFNINPDWIKHGDTEKTEREKYITINEGDIESDVIKLLYKLKKNLNYYEYTLTVAKIIEIDEKGDPGLTGIVIINEDKYNIFARCLSIFEESELLTLKNIIYALKSEGIIVHLYKITAKERESFTGIDFFDLFGGLISPKLIISSLNPTSPFEGYGLATKSIREKKDSRVVSYKQFVLSKDKHSPEYKAAIDRKESIFRQIQESEDEERKRAKEKLKYYKKEVTEALKEELNPRLTSVIDKIKDIYEKGTEDKKITIETVVKSLISKEY